jgi:hypothetical protein
MQSACKYVSVVCVSAIYAKKCITISLFPSYKRAKRMWNTCRLKTVDRPIVRPGSLSVRRCMQVRTLQRFGIGRQISLIAFKNRRTKESGNFRPTANQFGAHLPILSTDRLFRSEIERGLSSNFLCIIREDYNLVVSFVQKGKTHVEYIARFRSAGHFINTTMYGSAHTTTIRNRPTNKFDCLQELAN